MIKRKRILLVENNVHEVELTLSALHAQNFAGEVAVVRDGVAALDYLHRRGEYEQRDPANPMLVLMDVKLPKLTGLEVLRDIKSSAATRAVPVVMLTSSNEADDVKQAYESGANAYVVKPMDYNEFVGAVGILSAFWIHLNQPPTSEMVRAANEL